MDNQIYKPLASLWVVNLYAIGIMTVFTSCVGVLLYLGIHQINSNGEYAAESFGAINNIIVYLLGVLSGIVGQVIFGMEPTDLKGMTKDASDRAKENFKLVDEPVKTPNTDEYEHN
jgi:hypothetical protein